MSLVVTAMVIACEGGPGDEADAPTAFEMLMAVEPVLEPAPVRPGDQAVVDSRGVVRGGLGPTMELPSSDGRRATSVRDAAGRVTGFMVEEVGVGFVDVRVVSSPDALELLGDCYARAIAADGRLDDTCVAVLASRESK